MNLIPLVLDLASLDLSALAYRLLGGTSPLLYRLCGGLFLGLLLLCALAPFLKEGRLRRVFAHPIAFGLSVFATLLAYRWPSFAGEEMSHDEGLHLTIGMALGRDPLPYRGVDGASAGCLVQYPLALANTLGLEPTYATGRFLGLIMIALTLILLWRTLRALTQEESIARLAVLPGVVTLALAESIDYLAYNSEQPLNLLLTGALFLLVHAWSAAPEHRWRSLFALGLCLGAILLTKLQGAPAGVVLALAGYALIWLREERARERLIQGGLLTVAGLLPLMVMLVAMASVDLVEFFLRSAFVDGANYAQMMTDRSAARRIRDLVSFVFLESGAEDMGVLTRALILPALLLAGSLLHPRLRQLWTQKQTWIALTSLAFLGATLFEILYPGTRFRHYLVLVVPPLTLCFGLALAAALRNRPQRRLVHGLALALVLNVIGIQPFTTPLRQPEARFAGPSHVAAVLKPYLQGSNWLGSWGLDLHYCVQTKLPFHARMPFPFRLAPHVAQRDFWLKDYMARWQETQPACLVTASSPTWRLEHVTPIREYVAKHYQLVDAFVDRVDRRPVRIFVSRARLTELLGEGRPLPRLGSPWVPPCARELKIPPRAYRTVIDFDAPLADGKDLQAGTDLDWGLIRPESPVSQALNLPAGTRRFAFLARTVADDDPTLAKEHPPLEGRLVLRLRRGGQIVASKSLTIGPSTHPAEATLEVDAKGDYVLEASVELPRAGGVSLALLRWN